MDGGGPPGGPSAATFINVFGDSKIMGNIATMVHGGRRTKRAARYGQRYNRGDDGAATARRRRGWRRGRPRL